MKIALGQINTTVGDFNGNIEKILSYTQKAVAAGCELVVFPELALCGYPPLDLLERKDFIHQNYIAVSEVAAKTPPGVGVIVGYVEENLESEGKNLFNTAALIYNGAVIHRTRKRLLASHGIYQDGRFFEPGTESEAVEFKGVKLGLTICQDAWHDHRFTTQSCYEANPVADLAEQGAAIIINIAGSPYDIDEQLVRRKLLQRQVKKHSLPVVFVNQVGGNDGLIFDGSSCAYDQDGNIMAQAVDFAHDLIMVDTENGKGHMHQITDDKHKAVLKALVLGLRDFVHKNGFSKGLVGLSGGIDSALVLVLGTLALGRENMHAIYMPSLYSMEENLVDTAAICKNLDVKLDALAIGDIYKTMAREINSNFDPEHPGVAEQNLQARIRAMLLMAYSNRDGSLLLGTGNKSEIAVGYCTLYGDTCCAVEVIGDLYKTKVYTLANVINQMYGRDIIPQRIIDKAPSAELRYDQRDADELPDYDELDLILQRYFEENMSVEDLLGLGFPEQTVVDVVRRVKNSEYKRQQSAPILRVTDKCLGVGRHYPLAQGFELWKV